MKLQLKLFVLLTYLLFSGSNKPAIGQNKFRAPVWTFHDNNTTIAGLSLGLTSNDKKKNVTTYGVHFELLGYGPVGVFMPYSPFRDSFVHATYLKKPAFEKIYGIHISPIGTGSFIEVNGISINGTSYVSKRTNGISISGIFNNTGISNGLQFAVFNNNAFIANGVQITMVHNEVLVQSTGLQISFVNSSAYHRGLQIGLYNHADKLKGLQIGVWNENGRRKFPIFNW